MDAETIRTVMKIGNHDEEIREQNRRILYLRNQRVDIPTRYKLLSPMMKVSISLDGDKPKRAIDLMVEDKLMGWCWQTCEFVAPIIPYKTEVIRGTLETYDGDKYEHSWLEITRKNKVFVLDPCFNILCPKEEYDKVFKTKIKLRLSSSDITKEIINLKQKNKETYIDGTNSIEDIFYRTSASVLIKENKDKIKELKVSFFGNA